MANSNRQSADDSGIANGGKKSGTIKFRPLTPRELETIATTSARYVDSITALPDPRELRVAFVEQGNFTVALLKTGKATLRTGAAKRNPTRTKIFLGARIDDTGEVIGEWKPLSAYWQPIVEATPEVAWSTFPFAVKRAEKEPDQPNPTIGQQVALAKAVRARSIRFS